MRNRIFLFGLSLTEDEMGTRQYQLERINTGIPTETVIMQLHTYLKQLKQEYFNQHKQQE